MRLSKYLVILLLGLAISLPFMSPVSAEAYWDCTAAGVEKNGPRKVAVSVRLDFTGSQIISGQVKFAKVMTAKTAFPGGEYSYSGGQKLTRDVGPYDWVIEASWTGTNYNCDDTTTKARGTMMIRKFKLQNIAEMEIKSKDGSIWFIFPHGCEYTQVNVEEKPTGETGGN